MNYQNRENINDSHQDSREDFVQIKIYLLPILQHTPNVHWSKGEHEYFRKKLGNLLI